MQNKTDHLSIYKHRKGFTLIEVVVTITVIAILATIAVVSYRAVQKRAGDVATAANLVAYRDAFELYFLKNKAYPRGSSCLGKKPVDRNSCGGIYYEGEGCSALGVEPGERFFGFDWNPDFDNAIKPYINQPEKINYNYIKTSIDIEGGCAAVIELDVPTYSTYTKLTINLDGTYTADYSSQGCDIYQEGWVYDCKNTRQAYIVNYPLNKNGQCVGRESALDGATEGAEGARIINDGKSCHMLGGNIAHEQDV